MVKIDKAEIATKREQLAACSAYLKEEFIGIDEIIDGVISYLSVWYLMPELLTRPIIINLWGMTGVGKTDLVRKLVKYLGFQDRFAEIELATGWGHGYSGNVSQVLTGYGLNDGQPAIALFDEIQRFNTRNADGTPKDQARFLDFWELLSDGKLSRKTKEDLDTFLLEYMSRLKQKEKDRLKGEGASEDDEPAMDTWEAMQFRNSLQLTHSLAELTELRQKDMYEYIVKAKQEKQIYEPIDHARTLIFISGNLDEAYSMAEDSSEADIDADIFHAFTDKITLVDIKNALAKKFRPEQVARFGNIHLIYKSLTRKNFEDLISKEVARKTTHVAEQFGVGIEVTPAVHDLIYRNGVFPVQGVRPVYSSITDILDANWNNYLLDAVVEDIHTLQIDYDNAARALLVTLGQRTDRIPFVGRVDKIRQSGKEDIVANISVHECGHAVAYMVLTGMVPLQLKSKVASSYAGGFTFPHQIHSTKGSVRDRIKVYLAGGIAEELLFGEDRASTGRAHDRRQATTQAVEYVRKYGFDADFQAVYNLEAEHLRMNTDRTDAHVERLIAQLADETRKLLTDQLDLLTVLSKALARWGSLDAAAILDIGRKYHPDLRSETEGHVHIDPYHRLLTGGSPSD